MNFRVTLAKHRLSVRIVPIVAGIVVLKFLAHSQGWEFLTLNALFSGIVGANVFLMGFLLSGVLADYKESERLPGELAASVQSLYDELSIAEAKPVPAASAGIENLGRIVSMTVDWFNKKARTKALLAALRDLNATFAAFEGSVQPNFIARMKQDQSNIRRIIIRIHQIRETSFISSGYAIAEVVTALLIGGLVFSRIDPFYESVFFVFVISFLLIYMIVLIRDLDNPFGYYEDESDESVSLKPLLDCRDMFTRSNS